MARGVWKIIHPFVEMGKIKLRLLSYQCTFNNSVNPIGGSAPSLAPTLAQGYLSPPLCSQSYCCCCWMPLGLRPLPAPALLSSWSGSSLVTTRRSTAGCSHSALLLSSLSALQVWIATASATCLSNGFSYVLSTSKLMAFFRCAASASG